MFYNVSIVWLYIVDTLHCDYHESNRKQIAKQRNSLGCMTEKRFQEMPHE